MVAFIPALAIILYSEIERRDYDNRNAHERVLAMARNLASEQEQITTRTRQMLSILSGMSEVKSLDAGACTRILREMQKGNPDFAAIFAAKADGTIFASSVPYPPSMKLSDRKYFQDALQSGKMVISESAVGQMTGSRVISYALPVTDSSGRMIAVVIAGFNLDFYKQLISATDVAKGYVLGITDEKGVRLYRYPDTESSVTGIGTQVSSDTLAHILGVMEEGTYEGVGSDGITRIYAYKQLRLEKDKKPYVVVLAGISMDKAMEQVTYARHRNVILLGLSAFMVLAFAWYFGKRTILNRMDKLIDAAGRIAGGDLSARAGISPVNGEFGHLASAFDQMAASLEDKTHALQKSELRYKQLVENAHDMIIRLDLEGCYTFVNTSTLKIGGYSEAEMIGRSFLDFAHPECRQSVAEFYQEQIRSRTLNSYLEFPLVTKDGRDVWFGHDMQLIMEEGRITGFQAISRDISERKQMEEELEKAAITDPLTNLYNRRGFIAMASHHLRLTERFRQGMILCFIDLDGMKQINDQAGHEEGDNALLETAAILREAFRESDIIARIGGDEFAVLAVGGLVDHWDILRERLQQQIDRHNAVSDRTYMIAMSCGMAYYNPDAPCSIDDLMAIADTRMYEEKRARKEVSQSMVKNTFLPGGTGKIMNRNLPPDV